MSSPGPALATVDVGVALADVHAYRHAGVIDRFRARWDVSADDATALFADLQAWLWLHRFNPDGVLAIDDALLAVDEMWHTFICFTVDYRAFCDRYVGAFVDHQPSLSDDPMPPVDQVLAQRRAQYALIERHLGLDTLLRWYVDYPERYGAEFFRTRWKPHQPTWQPSQSLRQLRDQYRQGV